MSVSLTLLNASSVSIPIHEHKHVSLENYESENDMKSRGKTDKTDLQGVEDPSLPSILSHNLALLSQFLQDFVSLGLCNLVVKIA